MKVPNEFYEIWFDVDNYPDQWFLDEPLAADGGEIDARDFTVGRKYRGPLPVIVPIGNPGRELAFSFGAFNMPVGSRGVASAIQKAAGRDVEFFAVDVPASKGEYLILNALRRLACLDEERSDFTRWGPDDNRPDRLGRYKMISEIHLDPSRIGRRHIFRLRDATFFLFASDVLKDAIHDIPHLGVEFRSVM